MALTGLIAWIGLVLLAVGVGFSLVTGVAADSPIRVALRGYIAVVERHVRSLFLDISPPLVPALQALAVLAGLIGGATQDPYLYVLVPAGLVGPRIGLIVIQLKRRREIEEQTVSWLTSLVSSLKVTGSLADAFRQTLDLSTGALAQELDLMLKEQRLGLPLPDALRAMAARIRSEVFSTVITVIIIGRGTGGELPVILAQTAAVLRERFRLEGVLRKQTANAKMQLVVLLAAPLGFIVLFKQLDAKFFDPLFTNGIIGYVILGVAFGLWLLAGHMGRKILKVDM